MNRLKNAFQEKRTTVGLWQALANGLTAEICAGAGFDWLMFDAEHGPNTLTTLLAQLQAVSAYPLEPIVRPPVGDPVIIKQYLDMGVRTLLIPMVDSAEQARRMVAATRFPPAGIRGVASATSRAARFGTDPNYLGAAHHDICVITQIESRAGLDQIEAIAAIDGVDGLFIGPADLAGSLGHLGNPAHPEVQAAIEGAIDRIKASGKPAGIFAVNPDHARQSIAAGFRFISIGTDIGLLISGAQKVLGDVRG